VTRSSRICPAANRSTARRSTAAGRCDRNGARTSGVANRKSGAVSQRLWWHEIASMWARAT